MQNRPATNAAPAQLPAFGQIDSGRVLVFDELFAVIQDQFPISPGHALIIARRPVARFHDLTDTEKLRLLTWIDWTRQHLAKTLTPAPDGFNLGLNDGPAAGQTIPQLHFHVIPRYIGDVPDPRGGIRHVIPTKAAYWQTTTPATQLVIRLAPDAHFSNAKHWTGNDDTHRHHHGRVDLAQDPLDLVLNWKASSSATPQFIGFYRLHLQNLLRAGYIRKDAPGKARLRFVHAPDGRVYIQTKAGAPRLPVPTQTPSSASLSNSANMSE